MKSNKKLLSLLPLIILTVISAYTILIVLTDQIEIAGELYDRTFNLDHYLAFGAVLLCWTVYFFKSDSFKIILTAFLILGTLSLLNFLPSRYSWGGSLTLGDLTVGLGFQPFSFIILLTNLFINSEANSNLFEQHSNSSNEETKPKEEERNPMVDSFKKKYQDKSETELTEIANGDGQFQKAAVLAASELLREKYSK